MKGLWDYIIGIITFFWGALQTLATVQDALAGLTNWSFIVAIAVGLMITLTGLRLCILRATDNGRIATWGGKRHD